MTRNDVIQLCVEKKLRLSVYLNGAFAYGKGRRFCPSNIKLTILDDVCNELGWKNYEDLPIDIQQQVFGKAAGICYDWYDLDLNEAEYIDEHELCGAYEIAENQQLFGWLTNMILDLSKDTIEFSATALLKVIMPEEDEPVEVWLFQGNYDDKMDKHRNTKGYEYDCNKYKNPLANDLENLLVIQTKHLIEFEQAHLSVDTHTRLEADNKTLEVDDLFINIPSQRKSELLQSCMELAERYIKNESSYPDALQLWNMLKEEYAEEYNQERRVLECFSGTKGLSENDFRNKFKEWTKIREIKTD